MSAPVLVGVLNTTPDSFSDGGKYLEPTAAVAQVDLLIEQGAELIDIGGDSTRPGSTCIGATEEWNRVHRVVEALPDLIPFAVDTHHAQVAQSAITAGALMINDVSAGHDLEMFSVLGSSPSVKYVMMYSRCPIPHEFADEGGGDIMERITSFFDKRIEQALKAGIDHSQIILDPGMGKFISDSPQTSWEVIRRIGELATFGLPLYFGSSRKGFLTLPLEEDILERDLLSAYSGAVVRDKIGGKVPLYIRTHNVKLQRESL